MQFMLVLQHVTKRASIRCALMVSIVLSFAQFGVSAAERTLGPTTVTRKPSPPVAALPAPAAAGPLRILVVDDDGSHNNNIPGDTRVTVSDQFFLARAAEATGGDRASWSVEYVPTAGDGPTFERLQRFNLILWYTGASYGGNPDNTSVLSIRDEKTVRQYLTQTGGVVVLVSPGYVSKVLDNASSMDDSSWPFLSEVIGVRGGKGLAHRFVAGTAVGSAGTRYNITGGHYAVETQFSFVNPDGASVLFTTVPADTKAGTNPVPVATAFPYGKGRMLYIGFTLENVAEDQASAAFQELLTATGLTSAVPAPAATLPVKTPPAVVQSGGALRLPPKTQVVSPTQVTDAPQAFSLQGRDRQSFNFHTSHAGPIRLQVQATGAPVTVTVFHPDGRIKTQSGQGNFVVEDQADAADLARGNVWAVSIRLTSAASDNAVASGTITVSHPPSDEAAVSAQLAAAKSKTVVLGKVPPLRRISSLPESLRVTEAARPVERLPLPVIRPPVVPVRRVPIVQPTVPAPVLKLEVAGPPGGGRLPADVVGVRQALYVRGTNLFPPGTTAEELNRNPQQYGAELHFEYGDGQSATVPLEVMSSYGETHYSGRVPVIPGAVDVPLSVFLKTTDGRLSNRTALVYRPWLVTKVVRLPIVDYNVVNNVQTAPFNFLDWIWGYKPGLDPDWRLYDSELDASYSDAYVSAGLIIRDTYLFGFHGTDVFYKTLQLKNGWKTVSAKVNLWEAKAAGAEVVEFTPGVTSLQCKVRWYLDPTFLDPNVLKYGVEITIEGPADFPPL